MTQTLLAHPDAITGFSHPVIRRFESLSPLANADLEALLNLLSNIRSFPLQTDVVREGDLCGNMHVLVEGFACRYKIVEGGRRQIMGFLVPGDFCDAHMFVLNRIDHSILTLSDAKIALVSREAMRTVNAEHPVLQRAILWATLADAAISREWLANMGRRSPDRRIGHLLCEMLTRLKAVGLAEEQRFAFPITQSDLGDAMGLSTVHVNRTLQELKEKKLIQWRRGLFEVLDLARCQHYSDFDASYLHCLHQGEVDGTG